MATVGAPNWGETNWSDGTPAGGSGGSGGSGGAGGGGNAPSITSFTSSAGDVTPGSTVTLSWTVTGATSVSLAPGGLQSGTSATITPASTGTYVLTASNANGSASSSITVTVVGSGYGTRYHQIRGGDRNGTGIQLQMFGGTGAVKNWPAFYDDSQDVVGQQPRGDTTVSQLADQTGGFTPLNLLAFDPNGNAQDSGVSASSVLTGSGGMGSWYGQVPRGSVNGVNTSFTLDYVPTSPYTVFSVNGMTLIPQPDGPNLLPNYQYVISGNTLTMTFAPRTTDWFYIWYFRAGSGTGVPLPPGTTVASATVTMWTSFNGGSSGHGGANSNFYYPSSVGGSVTMQYLSFSFYSLAEVTQALTVPSGVTNTYFSGSSMEFFLYGSVLSSGDPNYFNVYDVYITLTMADTTVQVVRPTSYTFFAGGDTYQQSWLPNTNYAAGATVIGSDNHVQLATVTGRSGSSNPAWTGTTTTDNTEIWSDQGAQTSTTGQVTNPSNAYDSDSTPPTTYATYEQSLWGGLVTGGNFTVVF